MKRRPRHLCVALNLSARAIALFLRRAICSLIALLWISVSPVGYAQNPAASFAISDGILSTYINGATGHSVAVQADGKILVALRGGPCTLARYDSVGRLDSSFGKAGIATGILVDNGSVCRGITLQTDGKILAVSAWGGQYFELERFNADGTVDRDFGNGGGVATLLNPINYAFATSTSTALQADGKILVAGYTTRLDFNSFGLVRYNTDGSLDSQFGTNGIVLVSFATSIAAQSVTVQADGKILMAGGGGKYFALARFYTDGSLDGSFGIGGTVTTTFSCANASGQTVFAQPEGKILVVGGGCGSFLLARYNADGTLDGSFGAGGTNTTTFGNSSSDGQSGTVQKDGRIVVAGGASNLFDLARYNADGGLDGSFGTNGTVTTRLSTATFGSAQSVAMQPDGKIVVTGHDGNNLALARYNADGSVDTSFALPDLVFGTQRLGTTSPAQTVTLQNTGSVPLVITSITSSGDFAVTHNCGTGLGVKGYCTLSITFTPTTTGTRTGTVTIAADAVNSPQTFRLIANDQGAKASLYVPGNASDSGGYLLMFSTQQVGTTAPAQSITLSNVGAAVLNVTSISVTGDFLQMNNCGTSLAAGASCTIEITYTPTVAGNRYGTLSIIHDAAGGGRFAVSLNGFGKTAPASLISPGSLTFAAQPIGTTSSAQTVVLNNTLGTTFAISSIQATGDYSQTNNCGAGLGVGGSCSINVTFTPTTSGVRTGTLVVNSSALNSPLTVLLSNGAPPYNVYVRNYIPAALASAGYMGFIRVINSSGTATPITIAVIDQNNGSVGVSGTLTTALPAGAAVTYSATDIERALSASIEAGSRPRIRVTALGQINVQSFQSNPSGVVTANAQAQGGTSLDIPSYLPWALHTSGYASYLRVINTGSNSTGVSIALIDGDTGETAAVGVLSTNMPPGAALTYSGQEIEAALGVNLPAAARPRIRVTWTNSVEVQSFQANPGGVVTENGFAQSAANAPPYTVDIRSYIPAALGGAGYSGFIRVINMGSTVTPITVALIDQNSGLVGSAGTLNSALPAGAAVTYLATDVERALGFQFDAAWRPRIRVSGQSPIQVQSFQSNPGHVITLNSSAQSGTLVDLPTFLPWALNASGYVSFVRVINTGSSPTAVSVALIDGDTGVLGNAVTLVAALPPGAAVTYSGQQIEAVLGLSLPAYARPRLRLTSTAPVDVQSFQSSPSGVVVENGGVQ